MATPQRGQGRPIIAMGAAHCKKKRIVPTAIVKDYEEHKAYEGGTFEERCRMLGIYRIIFFAAR